MSLVTLNTGSSSVKFAAFSDDGATRAFRGEISSIGREAELRVARAGGEERRETLGALSHRDAVARACEILAGESADTVRAVGHRIVHGGAHFDRAVRIDADAEAKLRALTPLAPSHQPHNLSGIEAAKRIFPQALQAGAFDTAFHRAQPFLADAYALPRRFHEDGIRRYGFHGLSYDYLSGRLAELGGERRAVLAHLGSGASLCAVKGRAPFGSTMGLTALDGLPMSTRCGRLDPGAVLHLMENGLSREEVSRLLYSESGLKGLSGLSGDMRALERSEAPEAEQAIAYFAERCRIEIAGLAAALQGIDALVFSAGIGENSARIRKQVCEGLSWLGVEIDEAANADAGRETRISTEASRVAVWVIATDEEAVIARDVARVLAGRD